MGKRLTDQLFELRKDYKRSEISSQLGVPYDLLEASNPEPVLQNLSCGSVISLGGRYTVQEGDNFGSIAQQLSLLGRKVTPYELIKYNYNVDPQRIRPGQLLVVPTVRGNFLAIAALILIGHNFYLGVLIFRQPESTFRKAFALGTNVFGSTAAICLGFHDNLKRCRLAIAFDAQRATPQRAEQGFLTKALDDFLLACSWCFGCPKIGAESVINPGSRSPWYWFSDGHALFQGMLCITVCDLIAAGLYLFHKVPDLVDTMRDNYVYVTAFFLLRQIVFLFYGDLDERLPVLAQ